MIEWFLLPDVRLFPLPMADTHAPLSTVVMKWGQSSGVDATLAADFPLVQVRIDAGKYPLGLALGLSGASFLGFYPGGELTFDLYTFDGLFSFPLDIQWGPISGRVEWAHLSAHYGDAVIKDNKIPDNFGAWSREYLQTQAGVQLGPVRPYLGLRYVTHSPNDPEPLAVQVGIDGIGPWLLSPCGGADLQLAAENDWEPAFTGMIGACVQGERHRFRVVMVGRRGPEDTGQLHENSESYLGLLLGFDATGGLLSQELWRSGTRKP
jgi:hypothetical protein